MSDLHIKVNGLSVAVEKLDRPQLLVEWLRDSANLGGTLQGCDTAQCGACTVIVDGAPTKACSVLAMQVIGSEVQTIEGLANADDTLHPLQTSFIDHRAVQCGFCTPGMLMLGASLLSRKIELDEIEVRRQLEGNLCRCTGYQTIVQAIVECGKNAS
jgi:aerobic carbon-monoxide dehydrogenase small subunit